MTSPQTTMPKNIIVCSDGTGNTAMKGRGTNVFKVYEAVDATGTRPGDGCEQVAIYDDGVGTQKLRPIRVLAGVFGFGLARNVRQLYAEIARCYRPGDQLYLFGFSRGAFTVRTLAGFIDAAGILDASQLTTGEVSALVAARYRDYRKSRPAWLERFTTPVTDRLRAGWTRIVRQAGRHGDGASVAPHRPARVRFLGVWDTVDAVGFPVPGVARAWNRAIYRFKFDNYRLPGCVDRACQALALDEERASFAPLLWQHDEGRTEQVWFPGVHVNVGGGSAKHGVSLVALDWMMARATAVSEATDGQPRLAWRPRVRDDYRDGCHVHDYLYDSRAGLAVYYRYRPRDVARLCRDANAPVVVHESVVGRARRQTRGYAPGNLPDRLQLLAGSDAAPPAAVRLASSASGTQFAGARGFWTRWRQAVQVGFFVAQIALVSIAWRMPDLPVPAADAPTAWVQGVVEGVVSAAPGDWAEQRIVRPMFARPRLGLAFVSVFPLAYLLGLLGRLRIDQMNSAHWRRVQVASTESETGRVPDPGPGASSSEGPMPVGA